MLFFRLILAGLLLGSMTLVSAAQGLRTATEVVRPVAEPYPADVSRLIDRAFGEALVAEAGFAGVPVDDVRRTSVYVFKGDLDTPGSHPDDEVLIVLNSTTVCGFGGACGVIYKSLGNLWYEIYSVNASALPLDTFANGMRDLVLIGPGEDYPVWSFDGTSYRYAQTIASDRVAVTQLDLESKRPPDPREQAVVEVAADGPSFAGACIDGAQWGATAVTSNDRSGGKATYAACGDPDATLVITCWPDEESLAFDAQIDLTASGDGDPIEVMLAVGSRIYRFDGTATYNEEFEIVQPRWDVPKRSPAVSSLRNGRLASVRAGGATLNMHLTGSSRTLATMLESCTG